jgi:ribosomal protein S18 acetylase RimI-like enzyme
VFPPARRNKYASAMIEHIHSKFNKNIMVEVNQINTPAINLYKKFGFQFVNNRKKYYENKYDALVMKLNRI